MKTVKEWDKVLNYSEVGNGLTVVAGQFSDKVSNIVRNMVFLKGHILMLLSRYFTEKYILQKIGKLLLI